MSIRTDDLGFVFYEADEQEEKELEYVYAITDSWNYMGNDVIWPPHDFGIGLPRLQRKCFYRKRIL